MVRNANGGWYQQGKVFTMPKRLEIGDKYLNMTIDMWPVRPSQQQLARKAKICQKTTGKIIMELGVDR